VILRIFLQSVFSLRCWTYKCVFQAYVMSLASSVARRLFLFRDENDDLVVEVFFGGTGSGAKRPKAGDMSSCFFEYSSDHFLTRCPFHFKHSGIRTSVWSTPICLDCESRVLSYICRKLLSWLRGSVFRTSVFNWRTFPDLCLIYG